MLVSVSSRIGATIESLDLRPVRSNAQGSGLTGCLLADPETKVLGGLAQDSTRVIRHIISDHSNSNLECVQCVSSADPLGVGLKNGCCHRLFERSLMDNGVR